MASPSQRTDRNRESNACVVCGASLAKAFKTVTVVVAPGTARETTWSSCGCGAICRSERVREVAYVRSRMTDALR